MEDIKEISDIRDSVSLLHEPSSDYGEVHVKYILPESITTNEIRAIQEQTERAITQVMMGLDEKRKQEWTGFIRKRELEYFRHKVWTIIRRGTDDNRLEEVEKLIGNTGSSGLPHDDDYKEKIKIFYKEYLKKYINEKDWHTCGKILIEFPDPDLVNTVYNAECKNNKMRSAIPIADFYLKLNPDLQLDYPSASAYVAISRGFTISYYKSKKFKHPLHTENHKYIELIRSIIKENITEELELLSRIISDLCKISGLDVNKILDNGRFDKNKWLDFDKD